MDGRGWKTHPDGWEGSEDPSGWLRGWKPSHKGLEELGVPPGCREGSSVVGRPSWRARSGR